MLLVYLVTHLLGGLTLGFLLPTLPEENPLHTTQTAPSDCQQTETFRGGGLLLIRWRCVPYIHPKADMTLQQSGPVESSVSVLYEVLRVNIPLLNQQESTLG